MDVCVKLQNKIIITLKTNFIAYFVSQWEKNVYKLFTSNIFSFITIWRFKEWIFLCLSVLRLIGCLTFLLLLQLKIWGKSQISIYLFNKNFVKMHYLFKLIESAAEATSITSRSAVILFSLRLTKGEAEAGTGGAGLWGFRRGVAAKKCKNNN